jgi:predicted Ser/Thr protein kinase
MAGVSSTSAVVESHISRLWQHLVECHGRDDPTQTLLPVEAPQDPGFGALEAKPEPSATGRMRGIRTPPPLAEADGLVDTTAYTEFNRRYRVHQRLDEGGMANLYVARQHALARDVAVKILRKDDTTTRRLLFRAEALVTAYLEHPNIVPVYDAADNCLVMRRVRGKSLDRLLTRTGVPLHELPHFIEVLLKVCDAIGYAHSRGIIHRDIKAENIMVGEFGEVLVVDWGLALAIAPGPDGEFHAPRLDCCPSVCAGTPGCLPPEVACGLRDEIGTHTDVHMLGGLLYHILVGHLPFQAVTTYEALELAASNRYASVLAERPEAPRRLALAAERAMAAHGGDRGGVRGFADELHAWLVRAGAREVADTQALTPVREKPTRAWFKRLLSGA